MNQVLFFILAIISIGAAIMVVSTRNPVSSAMFLVLVMCSLAGLFVLLGAIFLAALQIIVYAGAIMVLFLFVIMLLNLRRDEYGRDPHVVQKYLGLALGAVILCQSVVILGWAMKDYSATALSIQNGDLSGASPDTVDYNSAHRVAHTLFTKYSYPFEVTSILLLAAIIGAVVLARKKSPPGQEDGED